MRIRVKLFATLSRYQAAVAPGVPVETELPDGATVANLLQQLELPATEARVIFVNGLIRAAGWPLQAGDEVGIFPPLGGG